MLLQRVGKVLLDRVDAVQTGYRFDVQLHQFTLHTLQEEYRFRNRALVEIFADFTYVFPRTWRALILTEACSCAGVRDGALALLASIFNEDQWWVARSGNSVICKSHGIPEGSKLGPACFNLLPNTLVQRLRNSNCGVMTTGWVPAVWASYSWSGKGVPDQSETALLALKIRYNLPVPPVSALASELSLEVTCVRALDLYDSNRIPVLFHVDDPVFLASSRGEASRVLSIVSTWAYDCRTSLHLGATKTVVMGFSGDSSSSNFLEHSLLFPSCPPVLPTTLAQMSNHKWLGLR